MSGSGPKCSTRVRSASKVSRRASKGIEGYRRSSKAIEGHRRPSKGIEGHRRVSRGVGEFVVARGVFPLHHPPLKAQRPDAKIPVHRGRNPIRPKSSALIRFGAFGWVLWKSAISCGASRSRSGIHEFSSRPYPFHLTKYSSLLPFILLSITLSISYLRSPPTISGGGGGRGRRPMIGSGGAGMSLTTWKTGWSCDIDGGSFRRYACEPTGRTTGKGPKYRCANFFEGRVMLMSDASRKTFSPTVNVGAGVRRWL